MSELLLVLPLLTGTPSSRFCNFDSEPSLGDSRAAEVAIGRTQVPVSLCGWKNLFSAYICMLGRPREAFEVSSFDEEATARIAEGNLLIVVDIAHTAMFQGTVTALTGSWLLDFSQIVPYIKRCNTSKRCERRISRRFTTSRSWPELMSLQRYRSRNSIAKFLDSCLYFQVLKRQSSI